MACVDRIDLYYVSIPLAASRPGFFAERPYFRPSWIPGFRQSEVRFYLLRLRTDEGLEGAAAMPAMGPERESLGPLLGNYLLGINPLDIGLVNQRIQEFSYLGLRNGWIDAAFWDLIGKMKGQPLWRLLGGHGGHVHPYASTGETHDHRPDLIRDIVRRHRDQGFRGVKLRVKHHELAPMVDFVGAARDAAGPDMALMVDANQGWPVDILDETPRWDLEFATRFARAIEPFNVAWLEEPLNRGNLEGLARLRNSTRTPIAGGEMNSSWRDFLAMLELDSLDVYQPDAVLVGGSYAGGVSVCYWLIRALEARRQADPASARKFSPHTWTTGLGFALALQLVGVLPPEQRSLIEYPLEGPWRPEAWARFVRGGFAPDRDGRIPIPERPGLGVEIDWSVIRRFGRRVYRGTRASVGWHALRDRGWKQTQYLKRKKQEQSERWRQASFELPLPPF